MLFWLKKTLTIPFLPLYFSLIAGSIGALLVFRGRRQNLGIRLLLASFGCLAVFSNKEISGRLIGHLEDGYRAIPEVWSAEEVPEELKRCAAVVVLGGGHADAPKLSRINQLSTASLSRVGDAVRLLRWLPAAKLVTSGHHTEAISHARVLAEAAISLGVDPTRIERMDMPRDTEDEIATLAQRFPGKQVAIVTSAWHMRRTMELCAGFGVTAVPCPADFMLKPEPEEKWAWLRWDLESLERSTKAVHEYLGLLWLRLRGK